MHEIPLQTIQQLSSHLRSLRRRLGLTQAQLGGRLGVEQAPNRQDRAQSRQHQRRAADSTSDRTRSRDPHPPERRQVQSHCRTQGSLVIHALSCSLDERAAGRDWSTGKSEASNVQLRCWLTKSEFFRALSLSIPITTDLEVRGPRASYLLRQPAAGNPDIRRRIGARFEVRADAFDLLTAIGRDCVGAVQLLPPGYSARGWDRNQRDSAERGSVRAHLRMSCAADAFAGDEDTTSFESPSPARRKKSAFLRMGGRLVPSRRAYPDNPHRETADGQHRRRPDFKLSVEKDWLCAQFLKAMASTSHYQLRALRGPHVLVVERFDRRCWVRSPWR